MSKFNTAVNLYLGAFTELRADLAPIGDGKVTAAGRSFSDRRMEQATDKFWATIQLSMDAFTEFLKESFELAALTLNGVPKEHEDTWKSEAGKKANPVVKEVAAMLAHLSAHLSTEEKEEAELISTFTPEEYLIVFNKVLRKGE